ncbi:FtsX-like permease family protein [Desulfococcus sp.]|uniref:FtsX-like permease family protein n=1 Tax=Desulfococcus sp. TaxID=2025834 RepID=UPI00359344A9
MKGRGIPGRAVGILLLIAFLAAPAAGEDNPETMALELRKTIETLAGLEDRSTGTDGCSRAAGIIATAFSELGIETVDRFQYALPVRGPGRGALTVSGRTVPLLPLQTNAVTPETIPPEGMSGPLYYVGSGALADFNGKEIAGAILLMDLGSGKNWLHAADFGAKALIYIDTGTRSRVYFEDKQELSPIMFPRFWMPLEQARNLFGRFESAPGGAVAERVVLSSDVRWTEAEAEHVYALIPGADPVLSEELVIVEAFYDSTPAVFTRSPGADEATGAAALLALGRHLTARPPARSVLLVATSGHAQGLHGMREMIWSIRTPTKEMRKEEKRLKDLRKDCRGMLEILAGISPDGPAGDTDDLALQEALAERIKTEVDALSQRLMALRMAKKEDQDPAAIQALAEERMMLRRLGWRSRFDGLSGPEKAALSRLIRLAAGDFERILGDTQNQLRRVDSQKRFRGTVKARELAAVISLHLSSRGDGVGAFNDGWLYDIKPQINRVGPYAAVEEILRRAAADPENSAGMAAYRDTLRPSALRSWQSYLVDRPAMGGEVAALAGYLGLTLATVNDARILWGTPDDLPAAVDMEYAARQARRVFCLIDALAHAPENYSGELPRDGFSTVTGRARRLRHGELFPDQAAEDTVILAFQGRGRYHAMTDAQGIFRLKGVAEKRLMLDKVIIEGYRFDAKTGEVVWAVDKNQTGKPAYRLKMQRQNMETDLVMFAARQTTLFNLLEPRNFRYLTKIQLIDGRRESLPLRYWYSRIDTRASTIAAVHLEPGTYLKLTLSDSVLSKKMVLLNADGDDPHGMGYRVDDWPAVHHTSFRVARDMWTLLTPRIRNLEAHGIHDQKINALWKEGTDALKQAETALENLRYDRFTEAALTSWALADRVYNQVEKTQKDVLFGVLFYIALFVPFAFCAERLLFAFRSINRRIVAFLSILMLLIAVIYQVHPAFQLAYSPTVVILAFFIMGLSLMVSLIVFVRFEQEMVLLQRRATQMRAEEISRWKAFTAAFFLGVSNLKRRRIRTGLTCATLIILTFTIMSFTSVKSTRLHARLLFQNTAPYQGYLIKSFNWQDLPPEALGILTNAFAGKAAVVPRIFLEDEDRTRATAIPIQFRDRVFEARGMTGLSPLEPEVTGLDRALTAGKWFSRDDERAVLLPERIARSLGIPSDGFDDPSGNVMVSIWGVPFRVAGILSSEKLQALPDLDGEILTPVTFPSEVTAEMTEAEMDAVESGEDIQSFQSRYQHTPADMTVIVPAGLLLAHGGRLKGAAVRPFAPETIPETARRLSDRFGLSLFSGEPEGTFLHQASDTLNYSGVPNILIPLIIAVLIVLNTMIGSVYERKREIAVYTSVGLAPSHVSFLFIAEAMAFAVLSVVLGYILAQVSASLFAGTALWSGITVNYSSLAGVASMILVILVVLVSVIYPSRMAAEIAIPDVNRSWSLPEMGDNKIELCLPFLVKYHEHDSIAEFLAAYFRGHRDVSHGIFSTDEILSEPVPGSTDLNGRACIQLRARVWLAPFDFGIMQKVQIVFCPSEENEGFLEIRVLMVRETGEANAWKRINKAFIHALRKQLLVWRSQDDGTRERYAAEEG